jgi:D-sedoheptulose 7-phosphate isomerase
MEHIDYFFSIASRVADDLNRHDVQDLIQDLMTIRDQGGRVFVMGVGGSAANASHMVNDLRKLCHIEAYCPTDNVSELTARVNDDGWEYVFENWLKVSRFNEKDGLFIMSVGGGDLVRNISVNLIRATDFAHSKGGLVMSIVGKNDGYLARYSESCCVVPKYDDRFITPMSEAFQAVIWHCIVSHPLLQQQKTTW